MKLKAFIALAGLLSLSSASAVTIKVFMGSQQRPEVFGPIFAKFEKANPTIKVQLETGGATSEAQNQYLTTVLAAKDSSLDVFLIDVVRPATFAAAGWAEPLDGYFKGPGDQKLFLGGLLPGTVSAATIGGKLYSLPAFTDAQFLYYRKDLLAKYNAKVPKTWDELVTTAQKITKAEGGDLQGFNFQGAPIEGTVCNFLEMTWAAGGSIDKGVTSPEAKKGLGFLVDAIGKYNISPKSMAETKTDDSRKQLQAGKVLFGLNWSYAWAHFQGKSPDPTLVAGNVGVTKIPVFGNNPSSTCIGGWQWAINSYSKEKAAAFKLIRFMASSDAGRDLAVNGSYLPARKNLFKDAAVLKANPHFDALYASVIKARPRPVSAVYPKISEIIRTKVNAAVAGAKSVDQALEEMQNELAPLLK
jgi:multiple sugar transport system substrate-binding protein